MDATDSDKNNQWSPAVLAIVERGLDIAATRVGDLAERLIAQGHKGTAAELDEAVVAQLSDEDAPITSVLAYALMRASDALERLATPGNFVCAWCVLASLPGPGPRRARGIVTFTTPEAVRAHTQRCDHNPLVQLIGSYLLAYDEVVSCGPETLARAVGVRDQALEDLRLAVGS